MRADERYRLWREALKGAFEKAGEEIEVYIGMRSALRGSAATDVAYSPRRSMNGPTATDLTESSANGLFEESFGQRVT